MKKKIIAVSLFLALLLSLAPYTAMATESRSEYFTATYTLSGDGAADIVAIALAQEGRTEEDLGYTEDWCADFICDCAKLAGLSNIIPAWGSVRSMHKAIVDKGAEEWTYDSGSIIENVQTGDILILKDNAHTAIVASVDDTYIHCIEGNWSDTVKRVDRYRVNSMNNDWHQLITAVLRPKYPGIPYTAKTAVCCDLNVKTTASCNFYSLPGTESLYPKSESLGSFSSDENLHIKGIVENNGGEYWYRVQVVLNGSAKDVFFPAFSAETVSVNQTLNISEVRKPSQVALGAPFNVAGKLSTGGSLLTSVQAFIYRGRLTDGICVTSSSLVHPNSTGYSLAGAVNNSLYFAEIKTGGYHTYVVKVTVRNWYLKDNAELTFIDTEYMPEELSSYFLAGEIPQYVISFDPNGGACDITSLTLDEGSFADSFPTPRKSGFVFVGWYSGSSGGTRVNEGTEIVGDMTLYAHWVDASEGGICGDNARWVISEDNVLTVYGSGPMYDYQGWDVPWDSANGSISAVVISDGITTVGKYAFCGCYNAVSVSIADSVSSIKDFAFIGCAAVEQLHISSELEMIGDQAFGYMSSVESIIIPASVSSIGDNAFVQCDGLKEMTFMRKPETLSDSMLYAFSSNTLQINYLEGTGWTLSDRISYGYGGTVKWNCLGTLGDADGDGKTDLKDVSLLFKEWNGMDVISVNLLLIDLNADGVFDLRDIAELYNKYC